MTREAEPEYPTWRLNHYFGPPERRKDHEVQIETPVGQPCGYCEEPIGPDDYGVLMPYFQEHSSELKPLHHECEMRMVLGSAAHLRGQCSCYVPGSLENDSPGLSRREGALEAFAALREVKMLDSLTDIQKRLGSIYTQELDHG